MEYQAIGSRFDVGISLKTNNKEAFQTIPAHWQRFWSQNIFEQIPDKKSKEVMGVYTDYEGCHTDPYTLIIGCEVASCANVPQGMVCKAIPASKIAVFTSVSLFPQSLIDVWQKIWSLNFKRAYKADLEVYPPDFHPVENPTVKIYIGVPS